MKGIIKSIPVTEVTEGMQVLTQYGIGYIVKIKEFILINGTKKSTLVCKLEELKTLVVKYKMYNNDMPSIANGTTQLPLNYSQWQQVIDDNLLDKEVEFEIKLNRDYCYDNEGIKDEETLFNIAQILPQQKRMCSEEELREAMKYASSHNSSLNGINNYIERIS